MVTIYIFFIIWCWLFSTNRINVSFYMKWYSCHYILGRGALARGLQLFVVLGIKLLKTLSIRSNNVDRCLTVAGLQVSVDDGYDGLAVQVQHGSCNLYCPVHQRVRRDAFPSQGPVERPAAGVFHHQAEVGLLQAHSQKTHDVGVSQHGKELGLLTDALQRLRHVLIGVPSSSFHRHLHLFPNGTVHFSKTSDTDHFLQHQLTEIYLKHWRERENLPQTLPQVFLMFLKSLKLLVDQN